MYVNEKTYNYDSYIIHTVKTDKFKNGYIEVNFVEDIESINPCLRNYMTLLMGYSSLNYPSKRDMKIASENLYDAAFTCSSSRVGYHMISTCSIDFLHPKFIKEKNYLKDLLTFYFDLIMNPHIQNSSWNQESAERIKERIHASIDSYKETPTGYASVESRKRLFPTSYSGKRLVGTHEEVDQITLQDLAREYEEMIQNSMCEIVVVGDFDMDELSKTIHQIFYKPSIVKKNIQDTIFHEKKPYYQELYEGPYNQTQVLQYYLLDALTPKEKNYVVPLFQSILGTGALSDKLGDYLRIQESLCYTYASSFYSFDGYFLMATGIQYQNLNRTLECLEKAMEDMKKGRITQSELDSHKQKILTNIKFQKDSIYGIAQNTYNHQVLGLASFDSMMQEVPKVTIQDLKNLTKKMHKTYTYILKENEGDTIEED